MAGVVFVRNLSASLGMEEKGLLLLISLFLSYPLAFIYRKFVYRFSPNIHHLYFAATGMFIYYLNFGYAVLHSVANIFLIYLILLVAAGSVVSVITAIIINTAYLVTAYVVMKTNMVDKYEITWTIPHCVLTLRLTAVVWDVYDSGQPQAELSTDQKECVLSKRPTFLQMLGQSNVLSTFLIGPQFSMRRYVNMTSGKYCDRLSRGPPRTLSPGLKRLGVGLVCAAIYQIFNPFFPQSYFTEGFLSDKFLYQCFYLAMWAKVVLYRYVACWIIAEGSIIVIGLTYNGQDANGNEIWDGCANIAIRKYETCITLRQIIESFNINTNKWMAQYIYKRLKFAQSKMLSQIATLFYLAIWHGLYSGYYHTFAMEFFTMSIENKLLPRFINSNFYQFIQSTVLLRIPFLILRKTLHQVTVGYCLLAFCLLKLVYYWEVYKAMYFFGHIIVAILWVWSVLSASPQSERPRQRTE